jgi:hypothetical protein
LIVDELEKAIVVIHHILKGSCAIIVKVRGCVLNAPETGYFEIEGVIWIAVMSARPGSGEMTVTVESSSRVNSKDRFGWDWWLRE